MSTKEYGCFFCKGKSTDANGVCGTCGMPINISRDLIGQEIEDYTVVDVIGRGFYGWTLKVEDQFQFFSMKVIPLHRLGGRSLEDKEARALAKCSPHRNIARFVRQIKTTKPVQRQQVSILCLVFEYVEHAVPLREVIGNEALQLTKSDVVGILVGIASGLARMHSNGLWHNDLHDDNVLIRSVQEDENVAERYEPKLIDFGSVRPLVLGEPEPDELSDYGYLAKHILGLTLRFEMGNQQQLTPTDRMSIRRLRVLAHQLFDTDVSRRNKTPSDVVVDLRNALEGSIAGHEFPSSEEMMSQRRVSLDEPLANTNALNLEPQDIIRLFRDSLGWRSMLDKSEPVFIVGPRGCGKTMLLRFLSIQSQARPKQEEDGCKDVVARLDSANHIGFLVSLGQLRTPFFRSAYRKLEESDRHLAEDFCREFISAHFAFEVIRSIAWLHSEHLLTISQDDLALVAAAVGDLVGHERPLLRPRASLEDLAECLDGRVRLLSSLPDPKSYVPTSLCQDDALLQLARSLKACSWAHSKQIWFLLDDYSVTVIPDLAQRAYNPVLFRLAREVRVKISSEGNGPILQDTLGRKYKEGREFTKVNLGEVYFEKKESECRDFFEQILDARFSETGKGSLVDLKRLLQEHPHEKGFGRYIRSQKKPGTAQFYGFGLLCRLCSGDVSFIIEMLHLITQGKWDRQTAISPEEQDAVVKRFANRLQTELRSTAQHGPRLCKFAERLGNLIKQYLLKSPDDDNPDERLRIEIEDGGELSSAARQMEDELLRHSVLIPSGSGKSRKGLPTRRLFFRRLFAPCFPFSPSRKGCIALRSQEYNDWLLDPSTIPDKPSADQLKLPLEGDSNAVSQP